MYVIFYLFSNFNSLKFIKFYFLIRNNIKPKYVWYVALNKHINYEKKNRINIYVAWVLSISGLLETTSNNNH